MLIRETQEKPNCTFPSKCMSKIKFTFQRWGKQESGWQGQSRPKHEPGQTSTGTCSSPTGPNPRRCSYLNEIWSYDPETSGRVSRSGEQNRNCSFHTVSCVKFTQFMFGNILCNYHFQQFQRSLKDLRKKWQKQTSYSHWIPQKSTWNLLSGKKMTITLKTTCCL